MKANVMYSLVFGVLVAGGIQQAAPQSVQIVTRKVGSVEVSLIAEGIRKGSPPRFVNVDDAVIKQYIPGGTVDSEANMFVIKTKEGIIVIDSGFGAGILEGLRILGIAPENVTAVVLTHTHGDHIGGLLKNGTAVFPAATLYLSEKELAFWKTAKADDFIKAYKAVSVFEPAEIGTAGKHLFAEITPYAAYGHTPGHTVYLIESEGQKLLIIGDLINVGEVQFPRPDSATAYDSDGAQAASSRKRVLDYAAQNGIVLSGMHLVFPATGTVSRSDSGFVFEPVR
jgi:glyoxylase-like metal-dependent hydrolase (beta-lactamase superfamily II)